MSALSVEGLRARFGDAPGLEEISLEVAPGERLVLIGPSGAGKSTLLRAIAGLAPVEAGTIRIGGRDVAALPPERRDAVYLHQSPLLFPHLSVWENVAFPLRVRRASETEVRTRVGALLEAVGLGGFGPRAPRTLSGGQRHRVALARAIAARPQVLLLDEPLSSLDPALRGEVREVILAVQREAEPALLLVTHDLEEAGLLGERIGVLLERRLVQVAPPAELFAHPASLGVARLLGIPNLVAGRVRPDGWFVSPLGAWPPPHAPLRAGAADALLGTDGICIAADGALQGTVVAVWPRVGRTTAVVRIGETEVEVGVDAHAPPPAGSLVALRLIPERTTVWPRDP